MSPSSSEESFAFHANSVEAIRLPAWFAHGAFVILLAVSLIVPLIHSRFMGKAIELARVPTVMLPLEFLLLRDYGHAARWLPIGVIAHWLLSLRFTSLRSSPALVALAVGLSLAIGFYALFCAAVLAMHISGAY